jgi:motility quorum-sensing regulator/GCU-specific mRNA interferase toxin
LEKRTPHCPLPVVKALIDRVWQDVYRSATLAGIAYIKLTVVDDLLIVSFKEH